MDFKKKVPIFLSIILFSSIQSFASDCFASDSQKCQQLATRIFCHVDRIKNLLDQYKIKIVHEFPVECRKKLLEEINIVKNYIDRSTNHYKKKYQACDISISVLQDMYIFENELLNDINCLLTEQTFGEPLLDGNPFLYSIPTLEKISKRVDKEIDTFFQSLDNFVYKKTSHSN